MKFDIVSYFGFSISNFIKMYAVIDCNNFYVSCERVFKPALENRPVVVLSNNDGCIISRSSEVKKMGVRMGTPAFEYRDLFIKENVHIFSPNFPLYADLSSRVMMTIGAHVPRLEVYSIDEAFIDFANFPIDLIEKQCCLLRKMIQKNIGITVSIGVGSTMTLAKAANEVAKNHAQYEGVCLIRTDYERDEFLKNLEVEDIWGIGRRLSVFLNAHGIYTAYQLMLADDLWVKKHMTIAGLNTVRELRGIKRYDLASEHVAKKSIISSRTFGRPVTTYRELSEAVSTYAARAAEKLREEKEVAKLVSVSVMTNLHSKNQKRYYNTLTQELPHQTDYTGTIIKSALEILKKIYRPGYRYKKAYVSLHELEKKNLEQQHLFYSQEKRNKENRTMKAIDLINFEFGSGTIEFASQGTKPGWKGNAAKRTPRYTTKWEELPVVE